MSRKELEKLAKRGALKTEPYAEAEYKGLDVCRSGPINQRDAQCAGSFDHFAPHFDIGAARRRIAAWMIADEDGRGGRKLERALDDLARIDGRVIDGARVHHFVADPRFTGLKRL